MRPAKFVAAVNVISDLVRNNHEFFADLEIWKQTGEKSSLIVSFIEMFNLFTLTERKRFVEVLKVLSMVLEEDEPSNL